MPDKIQYVCLAEHEGEDHEREGPTITFVAKRWAYCAAGAYDRHDWKKLDGDGLPLAELQTETRTKKSLAH